MILTAEEQQLAALFPRETRAGLMRAVIRGKSRMADDVLPVAESLLDKLAAMTDREFAQTGFYLCL